MTMHMRHTFLLGPLLLVLVVTATLFASLRRISARSQTPADTICVKPDGGNGCFDTISGALAAASTGDVIQVAAGDYEENVLVQKDVTLEGGWNEAFTERDPQIYVSTIRPETPEQSVVSIDNADPVLDGFTITGGRAAGGGNHGGGLRLTDSNALIRNNHIISNTAYLFGGGVWVQRGAPTLENNRVEDNFSTDPAGDSSGGGLQLENSQALLISNVISDNLAHALGGGVDISGGAVSMVDNHIAGNRMDGVGRGGGVSVRSTTAVTVVGDLVTNNHADGGGGIYNDGGSLFISGAKIVENRSSVNVPSPGGGLYIVDGAVTINNSEIGENRAANGGGINAASSEVTVQDSLISGNFAVFRGGGIANNSSMTLINTTIVRNEAGDGGGIDIGSDGTLFLRNTRLTNNIAEEEGGAIRSSGVVTAVDSTVSGNAAGTDGGGLFNYADKATLTNVTFSGNSAGERGGGIYNDWDVALTNTTLSGNSAQQGGGLYNDSTLAIVNLVNSTVTNNMADEGGGIYSMIPATLTNSIVASNDDENCGGNDVNSNGYNLEDANSCGLDPNVNDLVNTDPLLGPLQNNGGPTETHSIALNSPAVDAAYNDDCEDADQRGRPRVDGDFDGTITCDIGAYEVLLSFTVNSTADKVDDDEGDGLCDTGDTVAGEPECTLRAAIQEANALGGAGVINVPAGTYQLTIENPEPDGNIPTFEDFAANGDLDIRTSMEIAGASAATTVINGNGLDRIFDIVPIDLTRTPQGASVTIRDVTVENGSSDLGGGINNSGTLTLLESIIRNNSAGTFGGGIFNNDDAILNVIGSTIAGNFGDDSGGIHTNNGTQTTVISSTISFNTTDGSGGGINDNGALVIAHSTLHDNIAATNGGALNHNAGDATIFNVTLSGNSAGDFGGGLRNHQDTAATFGNVTIADNEAERGGGIYNEGNAAAVNTLFARNEGGNCELLMPQISSGHNLADDTSCGFDAAEGDVITTEPHLGGLEDNGGPTLTHALLAGSPAIDAGHVTICPQIDQRGMARPLDGDGDGIARCDIGAVETELQPEQEPGDRDLYLPVILR